MYIYIYGCMYIYIYIYMYIAIYIYNASCINGGFLQMGYPQIRIRPCEPRSLSLLASCWRQRRAFVT